MENLKALLEADTKIPMGNQTIFHNGNILHNDKASLSSLGVKSDDILLVRPKAAASSSYARAPSNAAAAAAGTMDARIEQMRQELISNPQALAQIAQV